MAEPMIQKTIVTHHGLGERFIDGVFVAMCAFGIYNIITEDAIGTATSPTPAPSPGPTESSGSSDTLPSIIAALVVALLAALNMSRVSAHVFEVDSTEVIHRRYRFLGFIQMGSSKHALGDLGELVLDTKRSWLGIGGFYGVYATLGLPRRGERIKVAFEVPMLWQNPFCDGWYRGAFNTTFHELRKAMHLKYLGKNSNTQTTTITYIRGSPGWADVGDGMNANFNDAMATYANHLAINPALAGQGCSFEMGSSCTRSVFYCSSGGAAAPTAPRPQAQAIPRAAVGNIGTDAATQQNIQAVQQYHQVYLLRNRYGYVHTQHYM